MDFVAIIALVTDQHPRAERAHRGEIFHRETNGLRCCGEATIAKPLPLTTPTLGGEQFGRRAVVKRHGRQSSGAVRRSPNAIQLAFFDDPLVRFIGIFNPVLVVIAFGWQEMRDLINAVGTATTEGSGRKADRLTDFEFVLVHRTLHHVQRDCAPPLGWNRATLIVGFTRNTTTTKLPRWAISKACISWFVSLRVLAKRCARSGPIH